MLCVTLSEKVWATKIRLKRNRWITLTFSIFDAAWLDEDPMFALNGFEYLYFTGMFSIVLLQTVHRDKHAHEICLRHRHNSPSFV